MNVILLPTFATRDRPQPQTHQPSCRHALGSAAPPEAVKNDSGTVQTVKATTIWWAIRLKFNWPQPLTQQHTPFYFIHFNDNYALYFLCIDNVRRHATSNGWPSLKPNTRHTICHFPMVLYVIIISKLSLLLFTIYHDL